MTQKELFTTLLAMEEVRANADASEKLNAMLDKLNDENASRSRNKEKTQEQRKNEATLLLTVLLDNNFESGTATEIHALAMAHTELSNVCTSVQWLVPRLSILVESGELIREKKGKKVLYKLPTDESESN